MRGEQVSLGPLASADAAALWRWINDRTLVLNNAPYRPIHEGTHRDWFAQITSRTDAVIFAIRALPDDVLIGVCQLHSIHPIHRSAELQIRIGEAAWRGKGCGREAVSLLLETGFHDLNLRRIYLHVLAGNAAAIRLYRRAGFVEEGRLREAVCIGGRYEDLLVMGLLRRDIESG